MSEEASANQESVLTLTLKNRQRMGQMGGGGGGVVAIALRDLKIFINIF